MSPTILVIFQSPWFHPDKPEILHLYSDPALWREKIKKSNAGKVLQKVFRELYDQIIFRAANPYPEVVVEFEGAPVGIVQRNPKTSFSARHIAEVVAEFDPHIIIALGETAQHAVNHYLVHYPFTGEYLLAAHPLDHGALNSLVSVALELRREMEHY